MRTFMMVLALLSAAAAGYFGLSGESGSTSLKHEYLVSQTQLLRRIPDEAPLREYEQSEELRQSFLAVSLGLLGLTGLCMLLVSRWSGLGEAGTKVRRHLGIIALCAAAASGYLLYSGTWSQLAWLDQRLDRPLGGSDAYKDVLFIQRIHAEQRRLLAFYASLAFMGFALFWTVRLSRGSAPSEDED